MCIYPYDVSDSSDSCAVTINLSESMVRDLCKYAEFHGRDVLVDIRLRLARSIERDQSAEQDHPIDENLDILSFMSKPN